MSEASRSAGHDSLVAAKPLLDRPRSIAVIAAFAMAASVTLSLAGQALAHETRMVGPYRFVVGWLAEPAFQGQANAASVRISDTRVTPAKPLEGLQQTLAIEIVSGGLSPYTGTVRAVFGQPGLYALDVIPTAAGGYSFRIKGKVETLDVNEVFESGPGRFDEVKGQTSLQYPEKVPVAADLTDRLDAIQQDLGSIRAIAVAALVLGSGLLLGTLLRARQRR